MESEMQNEYGCGGGDGGGSVSPSSSPPTPPSPLPVSVGPGHQKYVFSSSPSPSPPFSPHPDRRCNSSPHTSADSFPLLLHNKYFYGGATAPPPPPAAALPLAPPSVFSLDLQPTDVDDESHTKSSTCLKDLLEWLVQRCCSCCSWTFFDSFQSHKTA
ncbi:uncharacterized protein LOC131158058 [Malania oleifera]|uniref:uncharacterized protein LOC131158058 n=1 Tax=Malania oleifera TaxID=397392 RepID=UPI0025AE662B|nr:uncharacterized protein LOC131158058 [Malania oleifera]